MPLRWLAGVASAALMAASTFHAVLVKPAVASIVQPQTHEIHLWHMSVTVPVGWKLTERSVSFGKTTWTIQGPSGSATITSLPLNPGSNSWQLLPIQPGNGGAIPAHASPYMSRSIAYSGHQETVSLLTDDGTGDTLTVNLDNHVANSSAMQRILTRWTHPPVMTVTEAVTKIEHLRNWYGIGGYSLSFPTAERGWLLAAGPPATAQDSWYLFHTTTGGRAWHLDVTPYGRGANRQPTPPSVIFCVRQAVRPCSFGMPTTGSLRRPPFRSTWPSSIAPPTAAKSGPRRACNCRPSHKPPACAKPLTASIYNSRSTPRRQRRGSAVTAACPGGWAQDVRQAA